MHLLTYSSPCQEQFFSFKQSLDGLAACVASRDLRSASRIHGLILKSGFDSDVIVGNNLLNVYSKCGSIDDAIKVFEDMPHRTIVSWTSMMSGYCCQGAGDAAISTFHRMLNEMSPNEFAISVLLKASSQRALADTRLVEAAHSYVVKEGFLMDGFLLNSLIDAYAKCGQLLTAEKLIERSNCSDVVSWSSLISGAVLNGHPREAMNYFFRMQEEGTIPNEVTVLSILRACSLINDEQTFKWVHGLIMKAGWFQNSFLLNSLMEMYLVNRQFQEAVKVFLQILPSGELDRYLEPETVALLLQGCSECEFLGLGKQIHGYLIKQMAIPCLVVENSLINMYANDGCMDSAVRLFSRMIDRDIVSWNTLLTSLVRNGDCNEALLQFRNILRETEDEHGRPDFVTVLAMLQACSDMGSYHHGQIIHGFVTKTGLACDTFVQNSLIDMYSKTGRPDLAVDIFEDITAKDTSSWNAMIAAYGINGDGKAAVKAFDEMTKFCKQLPNAITFVNILSACVHTGMVEEGFKIFNSMRKDYGVEPSTEHFACMVDMLTRSGQLDEAEDFIANMSEMPAPSMWGTLLSCCSTFGRVDIAERAGSRLLALDPENTAWRVAISNVYASVGRWEDVSRLRAEIRELNGKEAAWSSVEVRGKEFTFMVNDTRHSESETIYKTIKAIAEHIRHEQTYDSVA